MGTITVDLDNPAVRDPANVVGTLVFTLLDVFEATMDLYNTLRNKEKRDHVKSLRSRGYSDPRRLNTNDEEESANDDGIALDKSAVRRKFDDSFQEIGAPFAVGDVVSQTALQSQIITLQSVIISTFLYGPTSPEPISYQLSALLAASRVAGTTAVDILAAQHQRQLTILPIRPRHSRSPHAGDKFTGTPLVPFATSSEATVMNVDPPYPAKDSIASLIHRPNFHRTETDSTSFTGRPSSATESTPQTDYCLYASDLQRDPLQPLSKSITDTSTPYCPYCKRILKLAPGKSWEIFKHAHDGSERRFRVQNRFVAKCHRDSVDGGYSCVLCSKSEKVDAVCVCGDVKALVRHVWMDHGAEELAREEDIVEVVEDVHLGRRRDSLVSIADARGGGQESRRSASMGHGRGRARRRERGYDRGEIEN